MKELYYNKNSIKGREANQKVIKDAEYFSLMKRIGDLHMIPDETTLTAIQNCSPSRLFFWHSIHTTGLNS